MTRESNPDPMDSLESSNPMDTGKKVKFVSVDASPMQIIKGRVPSILKVIVDPALDNDAGRFGG
jgi:hypothetical protein